MKSALALLLAVCTAPVAAKPALWVVHGSGGAEITLYGTVHALPKGVDWLTPSASARLGAADTLVLETIIPDDRFAMLPLLEGLGRRDDLKPLAQRVPAAAARIGPAAADAGIPLVALDHMKVWLAAITLNQATYERLGISSADGVEPALTVRARAANKAVIGLETPQQQLAYFDTLPDADQALLLTATLDDMADARADTDKLLAAWQAGDVDAIAEDFAREAHASPVLQRVLLTDRNTRWADWITRLATHGGKTFIAVGAGHFGGADGLLADLKARGLTVERVE